MFFFMVGLLFLNFTFISFEQHLLLKMLPCAGGPSLLPLLLALLKKTKQKKLSAKFDLDQLQNMFLG